MRLVVDAGPVIALSKTGYLDLLPALFDEVVAPAAVLDEVAAPGDARPGCEIRDRAWAVARSVPTSERIELQRASDIAAGEAEAILLAAEAPDSTVLLVDDRRARRVAEARGLHTLRTGALLVAAAERTLLQSEDVRRAIETLRQEHYLDDRAATDILALLESLGKRSA
jgi:predicted nucleic acid-binding protein